MSEPKQLLVSQDDNTQKEKGESGTAFASVGTSAQPLQSESEQTQTVKGESGVASAGVGNEARVLSKTEKSKGSNKYVKEDSSATSNTEARILESREENETVYAGSRSGDIEVEKRVLGSLERMVGENLGQSIARNETPKNPKPNIVDTILVKEVKKLIKKAIAEAQIGGGSGEGAKVINIDDGITEEMATYILANPGTMIEYQNYIYVPTYDEQSGRIYYASLAADEQTLYYLIIDYTTPQIDDEGSFPFNTEYVFTVYNPDSIEGYENEENINRVIRKEDNNGSIKETYVIDKIVTASTLVQAMANTEDYENGEVVDGENISITEICGDNVFTILGEDFTIEHEGSNYVVNYDQNGTKTYGIRFGDDETYGELTISGCEPNKIVRVIVGKYFEYDENGNKVFDEHCVIHSNQFADNFGLDQTKEITEERQVFEFKTWHNGGLYFDSNGSILDFDETRFILYGFETGEPESIEYKKHRIDNEPKDIAISRVYLSYDKTTRTIGNDTMFIQNNRLNETDVIATTDGGPGGEVWFNNPEWIYLNIESTPIDSYAEEMIKEGKFVMRFDYPIKHKKRSSKPSGVGVKSFIRNFDINSYSPTSASSDIAELRMNQRKDNVYFVTTSDIKINKYGEKYIRIKLTYLDFCKKMWVITGDVTKSKLEMQGFENVEEIYEFISNNDSNYISGIPNTRGFGNNQVLFSTRKRYGYFQQRTGEIYTPVLNNTGIGDIRDSVGNYTFSKDKLNRLYTVYAPVKIITGDGFGGTFSVYTIFNNMVSMDYMSHFYNEYIIEHDRAFDSAEGRMEPLTKNIKQHWFTSTSPRFAIIKDNYLNITGRESMWEKKYSKSDINIKQRMWVILDGMSSNDKYPVIRTFITYQK